MHSSVKYSLPKGCNLNLLYVDPFWTMLIQCGTQPLKVYQKD